MKFSDIGKLFGLGRPKKTGRIIGLGRSSEVYKYGSDKVLKLYFKEHPCDIVKWEYGELPTAKCLTAKRRGLRE